MKITLLSKPGFSGNMLVRKIEEVAKSQLMDIEVFDNFLIILPPFLRLHYSIKYGRPPPKVSIDFNKLDLPFEFIQAVSDIDGPESVKDMILFNCFDEQNI